MIRAFCELPAGLASVSLRLHGGAHCRPPISRMGNKAGYSAVILAALGLRSGEGAGAYVWAESDPDVRALLRAYPDADMLRRIADIIRGWKDEEPRALWERLRAERKTRGPVIDDESAAGWMFVQANVWRAAPVFGDGAHGFRQIGGITGDGSCLGRSVVPAWNGSVAQDCEQTFDRCHRLAEYAIAGQWAYRRGVPESGFNAGLLEDRDPTETGGNGAKARTCEQEAGLWSPAARASRWPPVAVLAMLPDAEELSALLGTPGDLDGVVVYMDPPYVGTTGYADDLPRADVVRFALDYHRAGAVVCVSEAVPVDELVAVGWHAADIAAGRRGQKRTFSATQGEVLTMSVEPKHRVATQVSMFGRAV